MSLNDDLRSDPLTFAQKHEVRPWGAFFGVCDDGGDWTFYLQENATITYDLFEKPAPQNHHFYDPIVRAFKKPKPIPGKSFSVFASDDRPPDFSRRRRDRGHEDGMEVDQLARIRGTRR